MYSLEIAATLARLSDAEFFAALAMLLVGIGAVTTLGVLHRPPGKLRTLAPETQDRAA